MIDIIINRDAGAWEAGFEAQAGRAAEATLAAVPGAAERFSVGTLELGITLSDDDTVRALNREHRGQDKPTNVLSFPLIDRPLDQGGLTPEVPEAPLMLGDVILAWETVVREAGEQGKGAVDHATHLVVHGVLHLLGYDHQAEDAPGTARPGTARPGTARPGTARPGTAMTDYSGSRAGRDDDDDQNSLSQQFRGWLRGILRRRGDNTLRDAIEELIEEQGDTGSSIDAGERVLLANILKLRDRTVVDAMVPRADIVAVDLDIAGQDLITRMVQVGHSRIPVYRGSLDDVVGIVHIKDVMACIAVNKPVDLAGIVREVQIVAPSMPVLDLLLQMRQTRQHMALVVDEFGGIDGLVTIEDLVEEIVGEIEDEHDDESVPSMIEKPDGTLIADARVPIEVFEERVGSLLDEEEREDIDTLGGLVMSMAGRVPGRGELLPHPSGLEFEVLDADPRRVKRIRVRNMPPRAEGGVDG